jgi:hypothetical protein
MIVPMDANQRRLRWSGFLLGMVILFWLPVEDANLTAATILSAAVCFLGIIAIDLKRQFGSRKYSRAGLLGGLCIGPVSFLLMVFKIGFHNHSMPDFTFDQLLRLIKVVPIWGITGFLLGWCIHLYNISRSR